MLYDKDIREPLFALLEQKYSKVRIMEEISFGDARADAILILEDQLIGVEIKSDADSYARLPRQIRNYDKYFDRNYIVIGVRHVGSVLEHVPPYWGVIIVEKFQGAFDYYILREAAENPKARPALRLNLLWRHELTHILTLNQLPKYTKKGKPFLRKTLAEKVEPTLLKKQVSDELFERDYTIQI